MPPALNLKPDRAAVITGDPGWDELPADRPRGRRSRWWRHLLSSRRAFNRKPGCCCGAAGFNCGICSIPLQDLTLSWNDGSPQTATLAWNGSSTNPSWTTPCVPGYQTVGAVFQMICSGTIHFSFGACSGGSTPCSVANGCPGNFGLHVASLTCGSGFLMTIAGNLGGSCCTTQAVYLTGLTISV